jgi:lycopene cyclase CruA
MRVSQSTYVEFPAALPLVRAILLDPASLAQISGAERTGAYWRLHQDLYTVEVFDLGLRIMWQAQPLASQAPAIAVDLQLQDATISTHAFLRVHVERPGIAWPYASRAVQQRIERWLRNCVIRLETLLAERGAAMLTLTPTLELVEAVRVGGASGFRDEQPRRVLAERSGDWADKLAQRFPQTVAHFRAMDALDHLERVLRLEQGWERILAGAFDARSHVVDAALNGKTAQFDLIYAGGGLGLLHAALMAHIYGRRVLLFDRSEVGCAHREWNISRRELSALVELGLVSWQELDSVIMREYRDGVVRFYNSPQSDVPAREIWLPEVLNVALDANALLQLMRRKLEAAGGVVLSGRAFCQVRAAAAGSSYVEVQLQSLTTRTTEIYSARLLLDGMGSTSPLALLRHAGHPFAGVCPTVGTVAEGFVQGNAPDELDPTLGDILLSVADAQHGEQLMWEGFPGRDDELTVYLFYYSTIDAQRAARGYSLLDLFEQYFTLLPTYKRPGPDFRHLKPVYGYIPARHSLHRAEAPLLRGVLPVGDAAAQQSPLTFCGFGSHVRNLQRTTELLDAALTLDMLEPAPLRDINAFQANVSLNWVFSRFMQPWGRPHDVNRLQNLFLDVLNELGVEMATRFFQDRMRWSDYHPMIFGVLRRYPWILVDSWHVLGPHGMVQWAADYLRFSAAAAQATVARVGGAALERLLTRLLSVLSPRVGLRVRAAYAEWRAMGWI